MSVTEGTWNLGGKTPTVPQKFSLRFIDEPATCYGILRGRTATAGS